MRQQNIMADKQLLYVLCCGWVTAMYAFSQSPLVEIDFGNIDLDVNLFNGNSTTIEVIQYSGLSSATSTEVEKIEMSTSTETLSFK